ISLNHIEKMNPDRIIISPGPGSPKDAGISRDVIRRFQSEIPILGVCLGHQCIASVFGDDSFVTKATTVMHGKTSEIFHECTSVLDGLPSPFFAARYHSLIVKELPKEFELLCWTGTQTNHD